MYVPTMYVNCIYPTMSIKSKTSTKLSKKTSVIFLGFNGNSVMSALIPIPFLIVAHHESGTRTTISWSLT
jgi:hypothetical protein